MNKKSKWLIGAGILVLTLIAWGGYKNPDRKLDSAFNSYQSIAKSEAFRKEELKTLSSQYSNCFVPEDADIATFCIDGLPKIKALVSKEPQLLLSLESLYDKRKNDLDNENRVFLENNIKLLSSKEYQDVYKGTIDVLDAYIDFYVYLDGEYDTTGLDESMSQDEKIKILSRVIANRNFKGDLVVKNLTDLSDNLDLKKEMLRRYIEANYTTEFAEAMGI
ncbi:MAG: hypothetical protein COZ49_01305 [Candidatus Yonathbacteria bacterium CG_4_10_14_3_um_filter_47_65]|uniref:Uncharacterized protein n=2 Tax=Parcubacteria group TaxID=1794811 RepID=A0A2M8D9M9_9BACT|nr:MAG: hypothetical protein AUJ44_02830 [Candidatus Nomurabacteria bacterium CG1_02_47_685]PIP03987.1 MAG: hypothetical protein COX54_01695 [Candidatus Yonathbacteria bacterium CG23_combo_of_CG06-09_8_20_14_all_46_18]PIQ33207.1 MAG: hypothetical protein COW61_00090 [Candidatus Yonathbacteria bacterium CG17_big_fil_post_rev_8_21_14_2_50_46_19]PIX56601.1 MAG: hypothetical protein COZ49_01305 [Candidatus Yonathbacteria bacterium CG_4_10_14_3_um_filter_47_65]PIY57401.1 MAG: hypothetical protein CO